MISNTASSIQPAIYFRRLTHFLKAFSAICCDWKKNSENLEVLKEMSQHILEEMHPIHTQ